MQPGSLILGLYEVCNWKSFPTFQISYKSNLVSAYDENCFHSCFLPAQDFMGYLSVPFQLHQEILRKRKRGEKGKERNRKSIKLQIKGGEKKRMRARERLRNGKERERGLGVAPGDHGLCPVLAAVGHPVWRPWPWGLRSIPGEHQLGNRPGNWRMQRGARDSNLAKKPCSICRNCNKNSIDNSKFNCKCIPFTIWVKINEGTKDSEEIRAEVITSVLIGIYISQLVVLGLDKNGNLTIKPESLFI